MGKNYGNKVKERLNGAYTLGLDIGTNSVGWAVINSASKVVNYKDKKAWGVRLFDAGLSAETRRLKRGMRRRINRRRKRVEFLQELFYPEISVVDERFFVAINELELPQTVAEEMSYKRILTGSSFHKVLKLVYPNKKAYAAAIKLYPTLYHLRSDIIARPEQKFDIRLVYLAIHQMVKKRGNFLNEGLKINQLKQIDYERMQELLTEIVLSGNPQREYQLIDRAVCLEIETVLKDSGTRNDRATAIKYLDKDLLVCGKALVGLKFDIAKLFGVEAEKEMTTFDAEDFSEKAEKILDDRQMELLLELQQLYITIQFSDIIGDHEYLCDAKVGRFNEFGVELAQLKATLEGTAAYYQVFVSSKDSLRSWDKIRDKKKADTRSLYDQYRYNRIDHPTFLKELSKILAATEELATDNYLVEMNVKISEESFLKKLNTTSNIAIPHQLNVHEAKAVLAAQAAHYPALLSAEFVQRVSQIISFRIPYFVGPLVKGEANHKFGWMVRKSDEAIRPWNFAEVVDKGASGEAFINRMVGGCTLLLQEQAMPKLSLTYQLFEVLNELNVTRLDEYRVNRAVRDVLLGVFLTTKNVTNVVAQKGLKAKGINGMLSGNQKEKGFATSLSSWHDMARIFGAFDIDKIFGEVVDLKEAERFLMCEDIIKWCTIFSEKEMLVERILSRYPAVREEQLQQITKLSYSGWGRLSRMLLADMVPQNEQGSGRSIIQTQLFSQKGNSLFGFQEIVTDSSLGFKETIDRKNADLMDDSLEISYDLIAELAGSPGIKRGIWQAISIIKECEQLFGFPRAIVIETAKEDGVKKRTISRQSQWEEIKKALKGDAFLLEIAGKSLDVSNDTIWLYLNQLGKCMYTGAKIDLDRPELYEIDHVIPYSLTGDNSFDNRVLVTREANQKKGGYKMPLEIIGHENGAKQKAFWGLLLDKKLISSKKHVNLLKPEITPEMAEGFANRQLVETRQITKHVIALLEQKYRKVESGTKVVGLKAQINDRVKRDLGIVKIRELNDKHHAVDAYMAAFIYQAVSTYGKGAYIDGKLDWKRYQSEKTKFDIQTEEDKFKKYSWVSADIRKYGIRDGQTNKLLDGDVYNYLVKIIDDTRFCVTFKTGTQGEDKKFWKETLFSPVSKKNTLPKSVGKSYLGVYSSVGFNKTIICEYLDKKGNKVLDAVDISNYEMTNTANLQDLLAEKIGGNSCKIIQVLEKKMMLYRNGFPCLFTSSSSIQKANQLNLTQAEQNIYIQMVRHTRYKQAYSTTAKREKVVGSQIMLVRILLAEIETVYDKYLNDNQVKIIRNCCNDFIEKYGEVCREGSDLKQLFSDLNIMDIRIDDNDAKRKKELLIPEKEFPEVIVDSSFNKIVKKFIDLLLTVMKRGGSRADVWSFSGRFSGTVIKCDELYLWSSSLTGLNTKKIEIIRKREEQ
ncbi:MAG: type II CRISPR RNA-guided endonuclease Cas9 [Culicoidibacterales bacterium]